MSISIWRVISYRYISGVCFKKNTGATYLRSSNRLRNQPSGVSLNLIAGLSRERNFTALSPIFTGKIYSFRLRCSRKKPIHWTKHTWLIKSLDNLFVHTCACTCQSIYALFIAIIWRPPYFCRGCKNYTFNMSLSENGVPKKSMDYNQAPH